MPAQSVLDLVGHTPLVALRQVTAGCRVPVLAKCEHLNPGGSIKDRIAKAIVADAEARGLLRPGDTLIEATAGNTGVGLALVAAARGYLLVCVMPEKMGRSCRPAGEPAGRVTVLPDSWDRYHSSHFDPAWRAERGD